MATSFLLRGSFMKLEWFIWCGLFVSSIPVLAADNTALKSDKDKLSYSIGASVGKNLKTEGTEIDLNLMIEGLKASFAGEKALLSDGEIRKLMNDYQSQMRQRAMAKKQQAMGDNKKNGEAYLAQYKGQKGVLALPSGVLYKILKEGSGRKPSESDMVEVNYRGSLINGAEFDATEAGHPANLKVSSLIAGWKQALSMMPVGSKWQIVIPAHLAYGERGVGNDIGPNEVLVFDLELLAIK
jgi:FKBP-type peptidyl-prolyl cis-trans isomerase FklB